MKLVRRIAWVVVLLLIVAGVIVYFCLDTIVKHAVERQSTNSLNLATTLGSARLAVFGGKVNLHDLEIASPHGFAAPHMFEMGDLGLGVKYGQLRQDPVRIEHIQIDNPKFVLEQVDGKMNFKAAMDQVPKSDPNAPTKKVIIDELVINGATVDVRLGNLPGLGAAIKPITVTVPTLTLKNIGNANDAQNGAAIKEVVMQVATALAGKAGEAKDLPEQFRSMLENNLTEVASKLGADFNKQIGNIEQNLQGEISKVAPGVDLKNVVPKDVNVDPGKLGDLLGGNKDKKKKDK